MERAARLSAPAGLAAFHQLAPATNLDLDPVLAGGRPDAAPGGLALAVADALDLIEAGDGVADVTGVVERLFAFLRKSERLGRHAILLPGAEPGRSPFDSCATSPRALLAPGALDVPARRSLLLLGGHVVPPLPWDQPDTVTISLS